MPRRKKEVSQKLQAVRRGRSKKKLVEAATNFEPTIKIKGLWPKLQKALHLPENYRPSKKTYLIILLIGLLLLASYKKGWFVAATVNGSPITNFELLSQMNEQYRKQTLNQMINEKIIFGEAQKKVVTVSEAEVKNKIAELENNVGGTQALDSLLSQQGQNREGLKKQIRIQLVIEKLYDKEATISAAEVNKFIEENKDQLQATESAAQAKEAEDILKQQKLSQIFGEKFQQLKQSAKIVIF